jgi:signal transduction histidine kinase
MILEGILTLMVLLGYLYNAPEFYQIYYYNAASVYGGITFMLVFLAVLASRPETGFMKVLTSGEYGSAFGLRILLALAIISIFLGWLRVVGQNLGYYSAAFGTALYTISILIILSILVWNSVLSLNKTDRERKEANKELRKNLEELEISNRELKSFAFITSHDLQEPLRTMASYAQLIERRYKGRLDPDADEFLEYMVSGAKRMKSMIQGLLDYSQVETKGNKFKEVNTEKTLDTALSNLQYSIDQCHRWSPPGGGPPGGFNIDFSAFEHALIDDLIPYVDTNFRTLSDQPHRAMAGLSMGGMQTRLFTTAHLDTFSHIGIFSAGSIAPADITDMAAFKQKVKLVFFSYGSRENSADGRANADVLKQAGVNTVFYLSPETGHEWLTWRRSLYQFAPLLFQK